MTYIPKPFPQPQPCECDAYRFPHRLYGGLCKGKQATPDSLVPHVRTDEAMREAGHKPSDF